MIYDEYLFFSLTKLVFFINKQVEMGVMWCFFMHKIRGQSCFCPLWYG